MIASTQFAMPAMSYFMWTQHWPTTELRDIDREARKIIVENGGKHPCVQHHYGICHEIREGGAWARSRESTF